MNETDLAARLAAARGGDETAFQQLTDPYRRELLVHCYRMLGTLEDAEDAVQETMLRAWRGLDTFAGRASLRAWLYKIATNASLDEIGRRRTRAVLTAHEQPADPREPPPPPDFEATWIGPLPDALVDERPSANPEIRYEARESVALSFLAALQNLPGRQRAVLILRDVLGWSAAEVAQLLGVTVISVNSTLQRARATVEAHRPALQLHNAALTSDARTAALLARYVEAWEAAEPAPLVNLLHEDAVLTMPPVPAWFRGRADIGRFLAAHLFAPGAAGAFRLRATRANGSPAFALYQRDATGAFRPAALHVLTLADGAIAAIHDFLVFDDRLFTRFGLPLLG